MWTRAVRISRQLTAVTSDQTPTCLAFADVKVTGDNHVPTVEWSNLSRTTHLQHSQKLDAWHGWKLLLLANTSVNNAIGFSRLEITAVIYEIATSIIVYVIELSRVTCKLGRLWWTANSHGGKHFGWQTDCGSEIALLCRDVKKRSWKKHKKRWIKNISPNLFNL